MKSYKEFINEGVWGLMDPKSIIFPSHQKKFYIPISSFLAYKLFSGVKTIIAFHTMSMNDIPSLIQIQNSQKSISTFLDKTRFNKKYPYSGVETEGGVIAVVQGQLLSSSAVDQYSIIDTQGRRWFSLTEIISDLSPALGYAPKTIKDLRLLNQDFYKVLSKVVYNNYNKLIQMVNTFSSLDVDYLKFINSQNPKMFDNSFISNTVDNILTRVKTNNVDTEIKKINKLYQQMIKEYIDACEKFVLGNKKLFVKILSTPPEKSYEAIITKFKIKEILIEPINEKMLNIRFEKSKISINNNILHISDKSTNIPVSLVDNDKVFNKLKQDY